MKNKIITFVLSLNFLAMCASEGTTFDVCKEFLAEQDRNIPLLIEAYKKIEKELSEVLHVEPKETFVEKSKREKQSEDLLELRSRIQYFEKEYPAHREQLRTLTEEHIEAIFTHKFTVLMKRPGLLEYEIKVNNDERLMEYYLATLRNQESCLPYFDYPIAVVFTVENDGWHGTSVSVVEHYFKNRKKVDREKADCIREEFLQEQEENVRDLLKAYKEMEKREYNGVRSKAKELLQKQYKKDLKEYESKKSEKGWGALIWGSSLKAPVEPTDKIVDAQAQKLIEKAEREGLVTWFDIEDTLVSLRSRIDYYENVYPYVKKHFSKLTQEQIKAIFVDHHWRTPQGAAPKGASLFLVTGDTDSFYSSHTNNYLHDCNLFSAQDDQPVTCEGGYPIALVFKGNRLGAPWSKVQRYFKA